jgi:hypothetical protein
MIRPGVILYGANSAQKSLSMKQILGWEGKNKGTTELLARLMEVPLPELSEIALV